MTAARTDLIIGDDVSGSTKRDGLSLDEERNLIIRARQAYYHGDSPLMSDSEYDALEARYARKRPDDPILKEVGAPFDPSSMLQKVKHPGWSRNGSQFKITDPDPKGFHDWSFSLTSIPAGRYHVSWKADGASLALYYENGILTKAVTRGNGVAGEDVTANAVKMKNVPTHLPEPLNAQVRAEVMLTIEDWGLVDPDMAKNPRNLGNGIMGRSNGHQAEHLTVLATDMQPNYPEGRSEIQQEIDLHILRTEQQKFEILERLGFETVRWEICDSPEGVVGFYEQTTEERPELDYWIDGVIIRIDDIPAQEAEGMRDNRPKGQVAWKFEDQGAISTLESVELSVGHTGAVIPTANLSPVEIGGTTVKRALLCNWEEIERLGVKVGDRIEVVKAGDIIPKITKVAETFDHSTEIEPPTECPVCGGRAVKDGALHYCQNRDCPAKGIGRVKRWVRSLNLLHVGDKLLDALYRDGAVRDVAMLYEVELITLADAVINEDTGMKLGLKRAQTAHDSIHGRKNITVAEFFGSLGVPHLGKRRVEKMIQAAPELQNPEAWFDGSLYDLGEKAGVPGIIGEIADVITGNELFLEAMDKVGVDCTPPEEKPKVEGKTFCITGSLPSGKTKGAYKAPLAAKGHELVNSVTKSLDYLVVADPSANTGKAKKARDYAAKGSPVKIISEEELQKFT